MVSGADDIRTRDLRRDRPLSATSRLLLFSAFQYQEARTACGILLKIPTISKTVPELSMKSGRFASVVSFYTSPGVANHRAGVDDGGGGLFG
jgi:hypothetical protein